MANDYKDLAKAVKQKYPEYLDVDDRELAEAVVKKYPEYKDYLKTSTLGREDVPRLVDDELTKLGWSAPARLSMLGNVGRENAWDVDTIFKGHKDPKNKADNIGIISWQGDRNVKLKEYLKKNGGDFTPSEKNIRLMTRFMDEEMRRNKEWQKIHAKMRDPKLTTAEASNLLRSYIKYVPHAPYNTPDPEFNVKNNRDWAMRAKKLGLALDQAGAGSPLSNEPVSLDPAQTQIDFKVGGIVTPEGVGDGKPIMLGGPVPPQANGQTIPQNGQVSQSVSDTSMTPQIAPQTGVGGTPVPSPRKTWFSTNKGENYFLVPDQQGVPAHLTRRTRDYKNYIFNDATGEYYEEPQKQQYSPEELESGYKEYLAFTKKPDTPQVKKEYLKSAGQGAYAGTVEAVGTGVQGVNEPKKQKQIQQPRGADAQQGLSVGAEVKDSDGKTYKVTAEFDGNARRIERDGKKFVLTEDGGIREETELEANSPVPIRDRHVIIGTQKGGDIRESLKQQATQILQEYGLTPWDVEEVLKSDDAKFYLADGEEVDSGWVDHYRENGGTTPLILGANFIRDAFKFKELRLKKERTQERINRGEAEEDAQMIEGLITPEYWKKVKKAQAKADLTKAKPYLDAGALTPEEYSQILDEEKALEEKYFNDTKTDIKYGLGGGYLEWEKQVDTKNAGRGLASALDARVTKADEDRLMQERRAETKADILAQYGSFASYYKAMDEIEERYKYRPMARTIAFATTVGKTPLKFVSTALQALGTITEASLAVYKMALPSQVQKYLPKNGTNVFHHAGDWLEEEIKNLVPFKEYKDFDGEVSQIAADAIGQGVTQFLAGMLSGGATLPTAMGFIMGASSQESAARKAGASDLERYGAFLVGGAASIPDFFLHTKWFGGTAAKNIGGFLTKVKKATLARLGLQVGDKAAGELTEQFFKGLATTATQRISKAATEAEKGFFRKLAEGAYKAAGGIVFEGIQEPSEDKINDIYAYLTYDRTPKRWEELTGWSKENQASMLGGLFGGAFGEGASIAVSKMRGGTDTSLRKELQEGEEYFETSDLMESLTADVEQMYEDRVITKQEYTLAKENLEKLPEVLRGGATEAQARDKLWQVSRNVPEGINLRRVAEDNLTVNLLGLPLVSMKTEAEAVTFAQGLAPIVEDYLEADKMEAGAERDIAMDNLAASLEQYISDFEGDYNWSILETGKPQQTVSQQTVSQQTTSQVSPKVAETVASAIKDKDKTLLLGKESTPELNEAKWREYQDEFARQGFKLSDMDASSPTSLKGKLTPIPKAKKTEQASTKTPEVVFAPLPSTSQAYTQKKLSPTARGKDVLRIEKHPNGTYSAGIADTPEARKIAQASPKQLSTLFDGIEEYHEGATVTPAVFEEKNGRFLLKTKGKITPKELPAEMKEQAKKVFGSDPKTELKSQPIDFTEELGDGFDPSKAYDEAMEIAKKGGVNILKGKDLKNVITTPDDKTVGAVWTEVDGNAFSFDIAVDEKHRKKGLAGRLIQDAFDDFNARKEANPDLEYRLDVTNPVAVKMMRGYGFVVDEVIGGHTMMTHPTDNPQKVPKALAEEPKASKSKASKSVPDTSSGKDSTPPSGELLTGDSRPTASPKVVAELIRKTAPPSLQKPAKEATIAEMEQAIYETSLAEIRFWQAELSDEYVGFYTEQVRQVNEQLVRWAKEVHGRDLTKHDIQLFHFVCALGSPSADPKADTRVGTIIFDEYLRTGELNPLYADKIATQWRKQKDTGVLKFREGDPVMGQRAKAYQTDALENFNKLTKTFKGTREEQIAQALDFLTTKHSYKDLKTAFNKPNMNTTHEYLSKKEGGYGVFGLIGAAKLGSYFLNRVGNLSTITKDMWVARNMARISGEPMTVSSWSETKQTFVTEAIKKPWSESSVWGRDMRQALDNAWKRIGEEVGMEPAEVQQALWDYEKRLWEKAGLQGQTATGLVDGFEAGVQDINAEAVANGREFTRFEVTVPSKLRTSAVLDRIALAMKTLKYLGVEVFQNTKGQAFEGTSIIEGKESKSVMVTVGVEDKQIMPLVIALLGVETSASGGTSMTYTANNPTAVEHEITFANSEDFERFSKGYAKYGITNITLSKTKQSAIIIEDGKEFDYEQITRNYEVQTHEQRKGRLGTFTSETYSRDIKKGRDTFEGYDKGIRGKNFVKLLNEADRQLRTNRIEDVILEQRRINRTHSGTDGSYKRRVSGNGGGVRVLGIGTVATFDADSTYKTALEDVGASAPTMHELESSPESAQTFHDRITESKTHTKFGSSVEVKSVEEYEKARLFLNDTGTIGFALKGDDIVSVFSFDKTQSNAVSGIMQLAIEQGGRRADAFDTVLPYLYASHGMKTVVRVPWSDEMKPEGWKYKDYNKFNKGRPDVVGLAYDPDYTERYYPSDGKAVSTWDDVVAEQDKSIRTGKTVTKSVGVKPLNDEVSDEELTELAHAQRFGDPEAMMLKAQFAIGGGVLNPLIEHVGDLTHRMNEPVTRSYMGRDYVVTKIERAIKALAHPYGFLKEHQENLKNNAEAKGEPYAEYLAKVTKALQAYADAHKELKVYNRPQELARDSAIHLGEGRFTEARKTLEELLALTAQGEEAWVKMARRREFEGRKYGESDKGKLPKAIASTPSNLTESLPDIEGEFDEKGRFTPKDKNDPALVRRRELKIAPAWTNVIVSNDPNAKVIAIGRDRKGRSQSLYSAEHTEQQLADKFERQRRFSQALPKIAEQIYADLKAGRHIEEASVLRLVLVSGFRIGSDTDTKAEEKAFGASNLLSQHIKVKGDTVTFDFIGKKGVRQQHVIEDKELAKDLRARKNEPEDRLFNTTERKVRAYLDLLSDDDFKVHDFRTWNATSLAQALVEELPAPTTAKEFAKTRRVIGDVVAEKLGDNRNTVLNKYIDPMTFSDWEIAIGGENERGTTEAKRQENTGQDNAEKEGRTDEELLRNPSSGQVSEGTSPATEGRRTVKSVATAPPSTVGGKRVVVDANGKPLKVYRGTREGFATNGVNRDGVIYFTPDIIQAEAFAFGDDAKVEAAYLGMDNPLDLTEFKNNAVPSKRFVTFLEKRGIKVPTNFEKDIDPSWKDEMSVWGHLKDKSLITAIKTAGFDGITHIDAGAGSATHLSYVVFDPAQVDIASPSTQNKDSKPLAPNGKPSNLPAHLHKMVRTPEFKKWFGDWENDPKNASKVVDANGEPLVVYHGTNEDVSEFAYRIEKPLRWDDPIPVGEDGSMYYANTEKGWYGAKLSFLQTKDGVQTWAGESRTFDTVEEAKAYLETKKDVKETTRRGAFFFAENPLYSENYTRRENDGGNIMPLFLSSQKLLDFRTAEGKAFFNKWKKSQSLNEFEERVAEKFEEGSWVVMELLPDFREHARSAGYDGYVTIEGGSINFTEQMGWTDEQWETQRTKYFGRTGLDASVNYAVFEPTQIKSVNNEGTFSPKTSNILKSVADIKKLQTTVPTAEAFASTFQNYIKQADRTEEDMNRIGMSVLNDIKASPETYVEPVTSLTFDVFMRMSDGTLYDPEKLEHALEATDQTRQIYEARKISPKAEAEALQKEAEIMTQKRQDALRQLADYLMPDDKVNPDYSVSEAALILIGASRFSLKYTAETENTEAQVTLPKIAKNNRAEVSVVDARMATSIAEELRNGKSLKDAFKDGGLIGIQRQQKVNKGLHKDGWKVFKKSDSMEDAAELSQAVAGTVWCTGASASTAHGQLSQGDFHVFFKNGQAEIAVRTTGDKVEEIRGHTPNQDVKDWHVDEAIKHLEQTNLTNWNKIVLDREDAREFKKAIDEGVLSDKLIARLSKVETSYANDASYGEPILDRALLFIPPSRRVHGYGDDRYPDSVLEPLAKMVKAMSGWDALERGVIPTGSYDLAREEEYTNKLTPLIVKAKTAGSVTIELDEDHDADFALEEAEKLTVTGFGFENRAMQEASFSHLKKVGYIHPENITINAPQLTSATSAVLFRGGGLISALTSIDLLELTTGTVFEHKLTRLGELRLRTQFDAPELTTLGKLSILENSAGVTAPKVTEVNKLTVSQGVHYANSQLRVINDILLEEKATFASDKVTTIDSIYLNRDATLDIPNAEGVLDTVWMNGNSSLRSGFTEIGTMETNGGAPRFTLGENAQVGSLHVDSYRPSGRGIWEKSSEEDNGDFAQIVKVDKIFSTNSNISLPNVSHDSFQEGISVRWGEVEVGEKLTKLETDRIRMDNQGRLTLSGVTELKLNSMTVKRNSGFTAPKLTTITLGGSSNAFINWITFFDTKVSMPELVSVDHYIDISHSEWDSPKLTRVGGGDFRHATVTAPKLKWHGSNIAISPDATVIMKDFTQESIKRLSKSVVLPTQVTAEAYEEMVRLSKTPEISDIVEDVASETEGDTVKLNLEGGELLRTAVSILEGMPRAEAPLLNGTFLEPENVRLITNILRVASDELSAQGVDSSAVDELRQNILDATQLNGTVVFAMTQDVLTHEKGHQISYLDAVEKAMNKRVGDVKAFVKNNQTAVQKTFDTFFSKHGYDLKSDLALIVEEIAVYSMDGDFEKLGLTAREASEYLLNWFSAYETQNGKNSLKNFAKFFAETEMVAEAIKKAKARNKKGATNGQKAKGKNGTNDGDVQQKQESPKGGATGQDGGTVEGTGEGKGAKGTKTPDTTSEVKNRQYADTLREWGRDAYQEDVQYLPESERGWSENAQNVIEESRKADPLHPYAQAIAKFKEEGKDPDSYRQVLGVALIDNLGADGEFGLMREVADATVLLTGRAGQVLRASQMASKYDFAKGIQIATKGLAKLNVELSDAQIRKIEDLTRRYKDAVESEASYKVMLEDATAEVEELNRVIEDLEETYRALSRDFALQSEAMDDHIQAGKDARALAEYWSRQLSRERESHAVEIETLERALLRLEQGDKTFLQRAFGAVKGKVGQLLEWGKKVTKAVATNPHILTQPERDALVRHAQRALTAKDPVSYETLITELDAITNGSLTLDDLYSIHSEAVRGFKEPKATQRTRYASKVDARKVRAEHRQKARAFRKGKDPERVGMSYPNRKILDKVDSMTGISDADRHKIATGIMLFTMVRGAKQWQESMMTAFGLSKAEADKWFVVARETKESLRLELKEEALQRKMVRENWQGTLNSFKYSVSHSQKANRDSRKSLDTHYKDLVRTRSERILDGLIFPFDLMRTTMTTADISQILRQGLPSALMFSEAWGKSLKGLKWGLLDDEVIRFQKIRAIEQDPYFQESVEMGVRYATFGELAEGDEHYRVDKFVAGLADKASKVGQVPVLGTALSKTAKAQQRFERAYTDPADLQRFGIYSTVATFLDGQGLTDEELVKAKKRAAYWANIITGKGSMPKKLDFTSLAFFAPSLWLSQAEKALHFNPVLAPFIAPKGLRAMAFRKGVRLYSGVALMALALSYLFPPDQDDDPNAKWHDVINPASKRFLKVIIRGTDIHLDPSGGMGDFMKLFFADTAKLFFTALTEGSDAFGAELRTLVQTETNQWLSLRTIRSKASPVGSLVWDVGSGTDFIGRPINWKEGGYWGAITGRYSPLIIQHLYDGLVFNQSKSVTKEAQSFENAKRRLGDFSVDNIPSAILQVMLEGVGANANQYERGFGSVATDVAWSMWERNFKTKDPEASRIKSNFRELFRRQDRLARQGRDTTEVDKVIAELRQRYIDFPPSKIKEAREEARTGTFAFVTKDFTADQIAHVMKYASEKELAELRPLLQKKTKSEKKKKRER